MSQNTIRRITVLQVARHNVMELEAEIKELAQSDPIADEAWANDALMGLADVISDMHSNLKTMEDQIAEPHPHESLEQTGRV